MSGVLKVGDSGTLEQKPWHAVELDRVLDEMQVHESGATPREAAERLQKYGYNELVHAPPPGFLSMLWDQLNSFVVLLLIAASAVSAVLGEWVDALAILSPFYQYRTVSIALSTQYSYW